MNFSKNKYKNYENVDSRHFGVSYEYNMSSETKGKLQ